jgi:hypothetical protein
MDWVRELGDATAVEAKLDKRITTAEIDFEIAHNILKKYVTDIVYEFSLIKQEF